MSRAECCSWYDKQEGGGFGYSVFRMSFSSESMLRAVRQLTSAVLPLRSQLSELSPIGFFCTSSCLVKRGPLELEEVQKVLSDVKADDVMVIQLGEHCEWTEHIVIATGRSNWHVKNIAQALLHKAKQKQKGAERMILPAVEGHVGGKWVVIDSGSVVIHALDEKARAYYDLESHFTRERTPKGSIQDLERAFVKVRPINNSKKKPAKNID